MTPTSVASSPITPAAAPVAAPAAATETAPTDFLLMLGQLVGAATPGTTGSGAPTTPARASRTEDDTTDEAALDLLAMLPLSLPITPPNVQLFAPSNGQGSAPPDISGIASQGSSAAAAQAQLLSDLLEADQPAGDQVGAGFDSMQLQPTMADTLQGARTAAASDAVIARPVHQPVGSAAWADEIGSRLTLMVDQGKHTASLRLSPEHLGPLEIRIAMHDDQASVWFGAAHADTRAAIETALPRLRELFASQGLSLADAGVFREPPRDHAAQASHLNSSDRDSQVSEDASAVIRRVNLGLLDAYA
jgi:flagellar hook-length control protein FliK